MSRKSIYLFKYADGGTGPSLIIHHTAMTAIPKDIPAYGFTEAKSVGSIMTYPVKPMSKYDADIVITYNGVCHTDIHMIDNDWGMARWPLIPGHEIVGHVINLGSQITDLEVGDVVALGCMAQSCLTCEPCIKGLDNICADRVFTYFGDTKDETGTHPHHGGFGSYMRTDGRKLFKVPPSIEEKYVGPLMCAGVTVFEPMRHFLNGTDGTGKTIAVAGIGGLGHVALQFAAKMGAKVIAMSRGTSKTDFAKELGAHELLDTTNGEAMAAAAGTIDLLIFTASGGFADVNQYLTLMKPYGNIHFCGIPAEDVKFNVMPMVFGRISISGSPVGGSGDTKLMLQFAAEHDIKPIIEVFPHSKANEAIQKVRDGSIRFRAVLKNDLV